MLARYVGVDKVNIHALKTDDISTSERIDITTLATHDIHVNNVQRFDVVVHFAQPFYDQWKKAILQLLILQYLRLIQ